MISTSGKQAKGKVDLGACPSNILLARRWANGVGMYLLEDALCGHHQQRGASVGLALSEEASAFLTTGGACSGDQACLWIVQGLPSGNQRTDVLLGNDWRDQLLQQQHFARMVNGRRLAEDCAPKWWQEESDWGLESLENQGCAECDGRPGALFNKSALGLQKHNWALCDAGFQVFWNRPLLKLTPTGERCLFLSPPWRTLLCRPALRGTGIASQRQRSLPVNLVLFVRGALR